MDHAIYSAYEFKNLLDRYWRGSLVRSVCLFCLIFIKRKLSFNSTISVRSVLIGFKCCNQGHFPPSEGHELWTFLANSWVSQLRVHRLHYENFSPVENGSFEMIFNVWYLIEPDLMSFRVNIAGWFVNWNKTDLSAYHRMRICAIFDANDGCLDGVQSYKKYICYFKSVLYTIIYDVFYFNRQDSWSSGFHHREVTIKN